MRPPSICDQIFMQDSEYNINITLMWPPEYQLFTEVYKIVRVCVPCCLQYHHFFFFTLTLTCNEGYSMVAVCMRWYVCLCAQSIRVILRFCKISQFKVLSLSMLARVYVLVPCLHVCFFFRANVRHMETSYYVPCCCEMLSNTIFLHSSA